MAWRQRRKHGGDAAAIELRLRPQDRIGGPPKGRDNSRRRRDDAAPQPRRRPKRGGGEGRFGGGQLFYWSAVLALWLVIAAIGTVIWIGIRLPPIQSLEIPKRPPSVLILGANGATLATRGEMGGAEIPLHELPDYVPKAFVAIEDRRFYAHHGVDPLGIARALMADVLHRGASQGGSTITQQLAKNLFLTQERTITRKLQEVVLALWLEHKFSKRQILELYLNRVYFGSGAYGIEAAAQRYFGHGARNVTLAEAAVLAGLMKAPARLAPNRNPEGARERAAQVIAAMREEGFIPDAMARVALDHPAAAIRDSNTSSANYAADFAVDTLEGIIGDVNGDITVWTTLSAPLQAAAESALVSELDRKGAQYGVSQGALAALTPDGAVKALIGGRNYAESQFNRAVSAKRQPGSAFKPFVYLAALERGLTPDSVREDAPVNVKGWQPENYSHRYYGPVTLTRALSLSLNTVAVRLGLEAGPKAVAVTARRLGITSDLEANPSLALGTSEVTPLELVTAYAPFANGGIGIEPHIVSKIKTASGKLLYQHKQKSLGRVIDPAHLAMMNTMMQETLLSGTARRASIPGWQAAGKTGTSQDFRDAWFVGYTSHLVAGVWLGNDDNSPTNKASGGTLPVEIWSRFMRAAHQGVPPQPLPGGLWQAAPAPLPPLPLAEIPNAPAPAAPFPAGRAYPQTGDTGAPVPPADIPNPSGAGRPRSSPAGRGFFDQLFGG